MTRGPLVRAVLALAVVSVSLFLTVSTAPRLGLDLRGGTQIVLETQSTPRQDADAEATERTLEVLRNRVDALGVSDPTLARSGENRIVVELPGVQDPREAAEVIGRTAQLTFHEVLGIGRDTGGRGDDPDQDDPAQDDPAQDGPLVLPDESGQPLRLAPPDLTGEEVGDASSGAAQQGLGGFVVNVDFRGDGSGAWRDLTAAAACFPPGDPQRRVAIVLDREVISSPEVATDVVCDAGIAGGSTSITGDFSPDEAEDLAVLIQGGALPLPVEIIEQRTVGPTLGADAIDASIRAAIIGLALTGLFIVLVYRLAGLVATFALVCYTVIAYAVLVALGATLTLPGLAGFVLAIGLAIDANVLVFERAREEYAAGRGLRQSLDTGFGKAWSAILDSNVTTLLAAGLLFFLASGPVRGFGVTLSIGVLASMISALVIARAGLELVLRSRHVAARPGLTGLSGNGRLRAWLETSGPDLMRRSLLWLAVAVGIAAVSVTGIVGRGLELGVEFTGGRLLDYSTAELVSAEAARQAVSDAGFPRAIVQTSDDDDGSGGTITVRTTELTNDEAFAVEQALAGVGGEVTKQRDELIGPSLGDELRQQAMIAFGVALAAQMVYLAFRFRWTFGLAAVLAMFHDVLAVVGLFAWLGKPIDGVFLAAALTIVGLSVNDSVVVFDRVRERLRDGRAGGTSFPTLVNQAVLQTVPRTVNTGLGAMLILAALTLLGGDSLTDFALALLVGLVIGTASTVFLAAPLAVVLERRWPTPTATSPRRRTADPYAHVGRDDDGGAVI